MGKDLHIEDGVLVEYTGPGGEIVIPEAVRFDDSPELLRLLFQESLVRREDTQRLLDLADKIRSCFQIRTHYWNTPP